MRRFSRHLFTILAALSLLLCIATCVLLVRSYWRTDRLVRFNAHRETESVFDREWVWTFISNRGVLVLLRSVNSGFFINSVSPDGVSWSFGSDEAEDFGGAAKRTLGFRFEHHHDTETKGYDFRGYTIELPHWFLALLLFLLPLRQAWKIALHRRRISQGKMPDLRLRPPPRPRPTAAPNARELSPRIKNPLNHE